MEFGDSPEATDWYGVLFTAEPPTIAIFLGRHDDPPPWDACNDEPGVVRQPVMVNGKLVYQVTAPWLYNDEQAYFELVSPEGIAVRAIADRLRIEPDGQTEPTGYPDLALQILGQLSVAPSAEDRLTSHCSGRAAARPTAERPNRWAA